MMADFTPIETQEQFDSMIGERLRRERETVEKKYSDYEGLKAKISEQQDTIAGLNKTIKDSKEKYAGYDKNLAELQTKVKNYETGSAKTRIALEMGIPYELAGRLSGETEEEIRADAETMKAFVAQKRTPPMKGTEPDNLGDSKTEAYKKLLKTMKGE